MTTGEQDLRSVIARSGGRLAPTDAVAVLERTAAAVESLRHAGVPLGPVTAADIMVRDGDGAVRITGSTPAIDPGSTSDVYALTGVLYECLTGYPPFPADATPTELLNAPPPRPTISNPAVGPAFDEVVARGLANDPHRRYATLAELVGASRAAIGGGFTAPYAVEQSYPPPYSTGWPPPGPVGPRRPSRVAPYLVAALIVALVGGFALFGFLTRHSWLRGEPRAGVQATLSASTPDGAPVSGPELTGARDIVADRLAALGVSGTDVSVDGNNLILTVPGDDDDVRAVTGAGQLRFRPVVRAIPAEKIRPDQSGTAGAPTPGGTDAKRIGFERQLRQSKNQGIVMLLAIPYVAERCGQPDPLAGSDDPRLPLVTCSSDGQTVYVLSPAILDGDQIASVGSGFDAQNGQHVIDLQFNSDATERWAHFTEANIGSQVAFTLDTRVLSAPEIREPIPGGKTQISGNFTAEQVRQQAATLQTRPLPVLLSIQSSTPTIVAGQEGTPQARLLMIGLGTFVTLATIGGLTYLGMRRYRRIPGQAAGP